MTIAGLIYRAVKGAALTWAELDGNFRAIKSAIEAWALQFENGSRRTVAFSVEQPDDTGVLWGKLNSLGAFVGLYWYNASSWAEMYQRTSWAGVDSSTEADSVVLTFDGLVSPVAGQFIYWQNLIANTGAATVAINGATALPLQYADGSPLWFGALPAGHSAIAIFSGTSVRVINPVQPVPPLTKGFTSAELTISTTAAPDPNAGVAHGLPTAPKQIRAVYVCKVTNAGYPVDRELDIGAVKVDYDSNSEEGDYITVSADATAIHFKAAIYSGVLGIFTNHGATGVPKTAFDPTKWKLKVYASA